MDLSSLSSLFNSSQLTSAANPFQQRRQDFQALTAALQSGDLAGAQKAFASFQQDLQTIQNARQQNGQTTSTGQVPQQTGPIASDIQALGSALSSGDIGSAQTAFATLQQDLQDARKSRGGGSHFHNDLVQSITQTLTELGLNPTGQATTSASASTSNDGDSATSSGQGPGAIQSLAAFLHSLFQAPDFASVEQHLQQRWPKHFGFGS